MDSYAEKINTRLDERSRAEEVYRRNDVRVSEFVDWADINPVDGWTVRRFVNEEDKTTKLFLSDGKNEIVLIKDNDENAVRRMDERSVVFGKTHPRRSGGELPLDLHESELDFAQAMDDLEKRFGYSK